MKMGIKEFRERLSEVARGDEPVQLTHHGQVVGTYFPKRRFDPAAAQKVLESHDRWQDEMREKGIDLEAALAQLGLDPYGMPLVR